MKMIKLASMPMHPDLYNRKYNDYLNDLNDNHLDHINDHMARNSKKIYKKDLGDLNDKEWGHVANQAYASKKIVSVRKKHFGY